MAAMSDKLYGCIVFAVALAALVVAITSVSAQDPSSIKELGLTTAELIEFRGFGTESHKLEVQPGYILDLVHVINPKIVSPRKGPVLFLHGVTSDAGIFVINSAGAKPKNYLKTVEDPIELSDSQLGTLLARDPAAKSLPLLLSNFGFSVWLLNRRAAPTSLSNSGRPELFKFQKSGSIIVKAIELVLKPFVVLTNGKLLSGLGTLAQPALKGLVEAGVAAAIQLMIPEFQTKAEPGFWNFSMDPQVALDVPKAVEYVLEQTGASKLAMVGHSLGAAFVPMAMVVNPELNDQVSTAVLLAPSLTEGIGRRPFVYYLAQINYDIFQTYTGPFPPTNLVVLLQDLGALFCQFSFIRNSICNSIVNIALGDGSELCDIESSLFQNALDPLSSKELLHLLQLFNFREMRFFDFGNEKQNIAAYGQAEPPAYDFRKITNRGLAIFQGNSDVLVPLVDTLAFIKRLQVPVELRFFNQSGKAFNHVAHLLHKRVVSLVNIPALKIIARGSER